MNTQIENLLPESSFVFVETQPKERRIGLVRLGESGFYPCSNFDTSNMDKNECRKFVAELNRERKVTAAQAVAMETGAIFGWNTKGSDPRSYESDPYSKLLASY